MNQDISQFDPDQIAMEFLVLHPEAATTTSESERRIVNRFRAAVSSDERLRTLINPRGFARPFVRAAAVGLFFIGSLATAFAAGRASNNSGLLDFRASIEEAARLFSHSDGTVVAAIDVPAWGARSHAEEFSKLKAAMLGRFAAENPSANLLSWYSPSSDEAFAIHDAKLKDLSPVAESKLIRDAASKGATICEAERPRLQDFNFFVWKRGERGDPDYKIRSLVFFIDDPSVVDGGANGRGLLSENSDVGELLIEMHRTMCANQAVSLSKEE